MATKKTGEIADDGARVEALTHSEIGQNMASTLHSPIGPQYVWSTPVRIAIAFAKDAHAAYLLADRMADDFACLTFMSGIQVVGRFSKEDVSAWWVEA